GPAEERVRLGGGPGLERALVKLDRAIELPLHLPAVGLLPELRGALTLLRRIHRRGSDGPRLAAVTHLPEHPLVPARRDEVPRHRRPLRWGEATRDPVGRVDDRAHDVAELLRRVRADPARVERVGRTGAVEPLPDLPVDPVTREQ